MMFINLSIPRFTLRASNEEDIFTYQLTYKSKNSYADIGLGLDSEALGLGVCHADDIFHIFKVKQREHD